MQSRPDIAVLVAECIAVAAEIDFTLGYTLSMLLGADYRVGLAMYFALTGSAAQRAAVDAAATVKMTADEKDTFDAVMTVVTKATRKRNQLAHWCWGTSPQLPDKLLLVDPEYKVLHMAAFLEPDSPGFDRKHAFVVSADDVKEILSELIRARDLAGRISGYMWQRTPASRRSRYLQQLRSEPEIQAALKKIEKGRKKSQPKR